MWEAVPDIPTTLFNKVRVAAAAWRWECVGGARRPARCPWALTCSWCALQLLAEYEARAWEVHWWSSEKVNVFEFD